MKIIVLGSSAGGGFPQWNCNCPNCTGVRNNTIQALPRTQSSIAVSTNDKDWVLINASPDILAQIKATPLLQPNRHQRDTGIAAVMLMDAQIDHVTGLLMLREGKPLPLYCTSPVYEDLTTNLPLINVLSHYCTVNWHEIPVSEKLAAIDIPVVQDVQFIPVPLTSKAPPYSPHRANPQRGDNLGLFIKNTKTGKSLFYAPGLGEIEPHVLQYMHEADCLLVDGTLWTADEMIRLGFSKKMAADMGHLALSGPDGMIAVLDSIQDTRKVLIHINNTNPILNEASEERAILTQHNIEVSFDGMEIEL